MIRREDVSLPTLAFSLLFLGAVGIGVLVSPDAVLGDVHGPISYAFVTLVLLVVIALPYHPFRRTWAWRVLFGTSMVAWGLHNLAGPGLALVSGYGFALLGAIAVFYGAYERFAPSTWAELPGMGLE